MLVTTSIGATKPHLAVQESDATSKASTSKTLQQECQGSALSGDWKCSTIQLVPNVRKWVPGTIIEVISARSYKVITLIGGVYVRNQKFIKIRHTDSRQSLKTTQM